MKNFFGQTVPNIGIWVMLIIILAGFAYGAYAYIGLYRQSLILTDNLAMAQADLDEARAHNDELENQLAGEVARNDELAEQVGDISSSVSQLEKLKKLDPELLKKYSKISFLNENYLPASLKDIPAEYLADSDGDNQPDEEKILTKVLPFLRRMLEAAADDDIPLQVVSAYRSFMTQAALKSGYKVVYGSGANQFSADQGYSEHQLGTTVDLTVEGTVATSLAFEQTAAYEWLTKNAHKYGFVLSYPKGNAYYQFEPWHWRFVGDELAADLKDDDAYFYDWDQRKIDTYLIKIFD